MPAGLGEFDDYPLSRPANIGNRRARSRSRESKSRHSSQAARVALLIETSTSFGRRLSCGVATYIRENGPWSVDFGERSVYDRVPPWLEEWGGDGIISRISTPEIGHLVAKLGVPVVDLNEQLRGCGVPLISNDHAAIGKLGAEHLLERGFTRFGYIGHPGFFWSDKRYEAFSCTVAAAGYTAEEFRGMSEDVCALRQRSWGMETDSVARLACELPKPIGIMACDDFRAVQLLAACELADVAVPEQIAVIGVGDDDVACELANPPLSSVMLNPRRMGYEAAAVLDRLMRGEAPLAEELYIGPLGIVTRQSTDLTAIADPLAAKAMRFIREHACDGINVEDVLRHVLTSRTALQDHFRRSVKRSVHDVIVEMRLRRVKEMLAAGILPLEDIAEKTGFRHVEYMSNVFKRRTGWTPARYRQEHGASAARLPSQFFKGR